MEWLILIILISVVLAVLWVYQFAQLMLLDDDLFCGRYDKPLWVTVFVLMCVLAPFAFMMWRAGRKAEHEIKSPTGES